VFELALAAAVTVGLLVQWWRTTRRHRLTVDNLDVRIHVNGIRGKSSCTRLVAGVLRAAGYVPIAKTTGSAAVVIDREGVDHPIVRSGPATILEQLEIVDQWVRDGVNALVIECMAINPAYQRVCERQIVRSDICCLTNVREDHQDQMGETLPEIARSLLNTCPANGVLITSEQNPEILDVIRAEVEARSSTLIVTDPTTVTREDMIGFSYIEFEENVSVGLAVADQLGIDRDMAIRGMWTAEPDPGVLRIVNAVVPNPAGGEVKVTWANMFAVNDRESTIFVMDRINRLAEENTVTVGILNNRLDRQQRALQFADIAALDLNFDLLVTFGAFERVVTERLTGNGWPADRIVNLGDERNPSWDTVVKEMILDRGTDHVLIAGMVNIHTHQAEQLLEFFENADTSELFLHEPETA